MKTTEKVRVRIAPSPTGPLHIGTARTALFNFLFARQNNGAFILRIEDTDKERSKPKWEQDIIENLKWLNVFWDEGINPENHQEYLGQYGPYRQSQRQEIYRSYIKKLLAEGKAYYCFCTPQELEAKKQYQMSIGRPPFYNGQCRDLPEKTVKEHLQEGKPAVIRFKTNSQQVIFDDLIKGKIEFDASLLGDMTIAKDESWPLYNLAAVIDDYEMKISHVIRGEDHISNTPKQLLLQDALGLPHPKYGHFALILGADRSKLSKRHGAVSISAYKKQGYLSEALINFMAFLGWNPGEEREIYSLNSLIKDFSLQRCHKSSAVFNIQKLNWINGFYIRKKSTQKITELCLPYLVEAGLIQPIFESNQHLVGIGPVELKEVYLITATKERIAFETLEKIIEIYKERLKFLSEIPELVDFFFKDKLDYPKNLLLWKEMDEKGLQKALGTLKTALTGVEECVWTKDNLQTILTQLAAKTGPEGDRGYLLWPLRAALSGKQASAGPFEIAQILCKEKTLKRIQQAEAKLLE